MHAYLVIAVHGRHQAVLSVREVHQRLSDAHLGGTEEVCPSTTNASINAHPGGTEEVV